MTNPLPLVALASGPLHAVFAPTRGGRLLSLRTGDEELLWQNPTLVDAHLRPVVPVDTWPHGDGGMDSWANLGGSKTWPAPQGWSSADEWAGPPDPVLDSGPWAVVDHTDTAVTVRSAADPRTGLWIERAFAVTDGGLEERITFTNTGDRTTAWAPWEVCQVRTDDGGTVVVDGATLDDEVDLGTWEGQLTSRSGPGEVALPVATGVAKRGYRSGRAVTYRRASGTTLALSAADEPDDGSPFPDQGARFEVWLQRPVASPIAALDGLQPDAHLAELEVLGRRKPLAPTMSRTTIVQWTIRPAETAASLR
ncbi:DUF4380 domain-containing protein [Curtobacterium sp. 9128]|uniref:DUF4380 domain-containing protein n=1 Tax=Curtobacterium sp. 9128 TaxID=1793722 RepID=UPI0011A49878|nr:DUF4380 domain-containing protein [Curtobacterium sp. 9128]